MSLRKWILLGVILATLVGCGEPYSSGDRVLVSKCAFDAGVTGPKRYEVVVFKYPERPVEANTPKNYIKRLLGLPGELIAIFFGRLYHREAPKDGAPPYFDDLKNGNVKPNDLWKREHMRVDDETARKWFDDGEFQILRKPPAVMLALRRNVYDNDFQAKDLKGKADRWNPAPGSTWKADNATGFLSDGKADQVDWLRYQHLIAERPAAGGVKTPPMLILDTLDYNTFQTTHEDPLQHIYSQAHWVGDLMIECNVEVTEAKGEFCFELSKGIDRFRACWDLSTGDCTLVREGPDKILHKLDKKPTSVKSPGTYMLRFANFDARLTVWVDRVLPFGDGVEYQPPEVRAKGEDITDLKLLERRGPTANDLQPASIGSKGSTVKLTHVRLWRDTYYRTRIDHPPFTDFDQPGGMGKAEWCNPEVWGAIRNQRFTTMYVQPGHYLCLGDNSESSSDSRVWGLVPERLMLGRALVVYFPIERIGPIR